MSGTWASGWVLDDLVSAAEFAKGLGCVADSVAGGSVASFDFTSIPAGYAHLLIVAFLRSTKSAVTDALWLRFNNDSGTNYNEAGATGLTTVIRPAMLAASASANTFSSHIIWVPHYAGSANFKTVAATGAYADGTNADGTAGSWGTWKSTAAINRTTLFATGGSLAAGSRASLYVLGA